MQTASDRQSQLDLFTFLSIFLEVSRAIYPTVVSAKSWFRLPEINVFITNLVRLRAAI